MASFSSAFSSARKAGKSSFAWNGKSYNTKLAKGAKPGGKTASSKKVPTPTAKPTKAASGPARTDKLADYPRPAKAVGIAKANSPMARASAAQANKPVKPAPSRSQLPAQPAKDRTPQKGRVKSPQGPVPEGVWYAAKGSAMSIAAARRANKPVKK
ncbi:hypothetical protein [Rhizobium sp. Leaf341]|uniref:hypothetical protein n=1 Tax=Rhizobium sp. Leaf341 TaxID=1736344 RepID=UPI0007129D1A|nr:hypothetical protein [Rhizobium sp. Leaf341]KQR67875.1 hypothetical protein ASG03_10165 [Rhizobium sp. Leaf341]